MNALAPGLTPIPVGCGPTYALIRIPGDATRPPLGGGYLRRAEDGAEGNRAIQNGGPAVPPLYHHLPAAAWLLRTASAEQSAPGKALLRSGGAPRFHVQSQPLALALQILDLGLEAQHVAALSPALSERNTPAAWP